VSSVLITATAGPYVASFTAVQPPARYAPGSQAIGPWTSVRASEAPARTGPWTLLGTAALDPLDTDPAEPVERRVTIAGVGLVAGWYLLELLDAAGNSQPFAPLYNGQSWRPSAQDVAAESTAYTNRAGAFDESTSPTAGDVEGFIDVAVREIAGRVGLTDERISALADLARTAAVWHAAASVEADKSPEGSDQTNGFTWKQNSYVACLNELLAQARSGSLRLT
jgi:hypothetical protein